MMGELFDEGIPFGAIAGAHLDLDQLVRFQGLVEFVEQGGMYPQLTHPHRGTQVMGPFFQFANPGLGQLWGTGAVLIAHGCILAACRPWA